jgi:F1F0 ATPase subunit 2
MNNLLLLPLALVAGLFLGGFFFGGLWWTVKKGVVSKWPALWFISSLLIRFCVTLLGFYWISGNHWGRMLMCLAGFLIARVIITKITRLQAVKHIQQLEP